MNAPRPWLRPLAALALSLGVVDIVLFTAWWLREPTPSISGHDAAPADASVPAAAADTVAPADAAADATTRIPVAAPAAETTSAVLYGTCVRSDGTNVAQGHLWLYRDGTNVASSSLTAGVYAFVGLQPGAYRLESRIEDALPMRRSVLVAAPRTRLDLRLEPSWVLKVHAVTPEGQPFAEGLAKAEPSLAGTQSLAAAAFADPLSGDLPLLDLALDEAGIGTFRSADRFRRGPTMEKDAVGVLTLPPAATVHVALLLRSVVLAQQHVAPDQPEVTFTLDPAQVLKRTAKVKLRVVDEAGAPVADCQVSLNDRQTGGGGRKTGADGRALFDHVVPGILRLGLMHKSQRGPPVVVEVRPAAEIDLGDVVLRPWVEVAFTGDFEGRGAVRLTLLHVPPGVAADDHYVSAENGTTLRTELYPGRYAALATTRGKGALFELDTRSLPPQPMHIDLVPGAPLRLQGGRDGLSLHVDVRAGNGAIYRQSRYRGVFDYSETLPLGRYVVTVTDAQGLAKEHVVQLASGGAVLSL